MGKYNFVHLHNHTEYSLLDGMIKIDKMVKKAKDLGMNAIAMTDHGNLYGSIEFYQKCTKAGIKPIIGCEYYMTNGSRYDKDNKRYHLVLLAKNQKGYKNLIKLSSRAFVEGYYYKPRIDRELLELYSNDLVCMSACLGGEIPQLIMEGKYDEAVETALFFNKVFGQGNFFLEMQIHGIKEEAMVAQALVKMSKELKIPLVATNDAHYVDKSDAEAHDVLLCIGTKKRLSDEKRLRFDGEEFYLKSEEEMERIFGDIPKALSNTQFIAEMCNIELSLPGPILPEFEVPEGFTKETYLEHVAEEGLKERYENIDDTLKERLAMELNTINDMQFPGYFLIVWDFIKYARDNGIWVGPGRGSGAGSLVAYCLGITNIDPMKYDLLFERFLNIERVSMPDFDIDFCKARRQEVIDYVNVKYTKEKVSQIVTFSKMKARAVIRDVGRVLEVPLSRVDEIAKVLPKMPPKGEDLSTWCKTIPELQEIVQFGSEEEKKLLEVSAKLENISRHTSVHAAGVVIGKEKITEYVPLQVVKDTKEGDMITTQFPGPQLEECGLVKMDFLGLNTLTLLRDCVKIIKESGVDIDLDKIPIDDQKVFELYAEGKTDAIFQFESGGMQKYLKSLRPNCLEDLIAMNALYRPGPMQFIDDYINRKHGREKVEFDHPWLEDILAETNGIMVYQEQVMKIAQVIAGYSLGAADILRRAMGKKKQEEMVRQEKIFIEGAAKNGISEEIAVTIFNKMKEFANYGFNKSHATAYAYLAYQSSYLKAYYPVEFMTAVLTSEINNVEKVQFYIHSSKNLGIDVLPPDVNKSEVPFSVEGKNIRYALCGIKGVGESASRNIVEVRKKIGAYTDFSHFLQSVDLRVVNKGVIEILVKTGGFDSFGQKRKWMFENIDTLIEEAQHIQADKKVGQGGLFDTVEDDKLHEIKGKDCEEWEEMELLSYERECLGFYSSRHPLTRYKHFIKDNCNYTSRSLNSITFSGNYHFKSDIVIAGIVSEKTIFTSPDGGNWARVVLEDLYGQAKINIFKNRFAELNDLVDVNSIVVVNGTAKQGRNEEVTVSADRITPIEGLHTKSLSEFHIYVKQMILARREELAEFKNDLNTINGSLSVYFHLKDEKKVESIIRASELKAPKDDIIKNTFINKYDFISNIIIR